jgi:micrococcal nuclease
MQKAMMKYSLSVVVCALFALDLNAQAATTTITLDGATTTVVFNDGDTFKVVKGPRKGERVRLTGVNTLETYGPVHQWLDATPDYLLKIANEATEVARNGHWVCATEKAKDVYGRSLATCADLETKLLSEGLAHAYSNNEKKAKAKFLEAQMRAQKSRVGMWKDGIPEKIITSVHSAAEGENKTKTFNRLISTNDGSTTKWFHHEEWETCQMVCFDDSCMVYVPFKERYGSNRPECLR